MRLLIYSHDTFGLGHLRRCRAIAHSLAKAFDDLSVLIISGSPFVHEFTFAAQIDYIQMPVVKKLKDGRYVSKDKTIPVEETLQVRSDLIFKTAQHFNPDYFLVDKEPLGLKGELRKTLNYLKERGTPCILGVRDVLDAPEMLKEEWARKKALDALLNYYAHIWIYGLKALYNPFEALELSHQMQKKMVYLGYLKREKDKGADGFIAPFEGRPFNLVTAGGGGDGELLMDAVLKACEYAKEKQIDIKPLLIILGPFMSEAKYAFFNKRIREFNGKVRMRHFVTNMEAYIEAADGVIAMGGYNSFCEILSFDKKALIVPRTRPRKEQWVRANYAQKRGLVHMIEEEDSLKPAGMLSAILALDNQSRPSSAKIKGLLDGFPNMVRVFQRLRENVTAS